MLRDIEAGLPAEGDHILGDLRRRAARPDPHSLLRLADLHVRGYEVRRMRSGTGGAVAFTETKSSSRRPGLDPGSDPG
jgi:2-dehydropantoate 2-reductase